jgi:hypothetical protein
MSLIDVQINCVVRKLEQLGYKFLASGIRRSTWAKNDKFVLKVPHNDAGLYHNTSEASRYNKFGKFGDFPLAACHIIHIYDIPLVKMEMIKPLLWTDYREFKKTNGWVDFVDCGQVGYDDQGNVVAYDYGDFLR